MLKRALVALIVVLSHAAVWGLQIQQGANEISCRLDPPPGHTLPDNALVTLAMSSGGQLDSAVPSGNGRVVFSGLTAGKYTLSVRAEGYLPVTQDVEIPSGYLRSTVNVNISLRPRPEASGAPPNHLARALILCGRLPDSIKVLNRALELQPPVDHARFLLAHVRYQLGDIQGAFKEMEAYLRTKPPKADELKQQLRTWKRLEAASRN